MSSPSRTPTATLCCPTEARLSLYNFTTTLKFSPALLPFRCLIFRPWTTASPRLISGAPSSIMPTFFPDWRMTMFSCRSKTCLMLLLTELNSGEFLFFGFTAFCYLVYRLALVGEWMLCYWVFDWLLLVNALSLLRLWSSLKNLFRQDISIVWLIIFIWRKT